MLVDIPRSRPDQKRAPGTWVHVLQHTPEPEYRFYWSAMVGALSAGNRCLALITPLPTMGKLPRRLDTLLSSRHAAGTSAQN